jgi:predicted O-methyltransferase YrrM
LTFADNIRESKRKIVILFDWIHFYFISKTRFQIHSPKVYSFIEAVLENNKDYYQYGIIEETREILLHDHREIEFRDFGTGSKKLKGTKRKVSAMAKTILADKNKIKILFQIALYSKANTIVELGTAFGLSGMALASAINKSALYTIEGDQETAKIATAVFKRNKLANIVQYQGVFANVLPGILKSLKKIDLVLIDGNHSYEATLAYFKTILPYCHQNTILIFDDIYWSKGMIKAWREIEKSQEIAFTIDLFYYGLVFFDKLMAENQNFKLIKSKWKPFSMGFWS